MNNRFQFVADHQRRYGVKRLCQILGIAPSSFYHWVKTALARAAREAADARQPNGSSGTTTAACTVR